MIKARWNLGVGIVKADAQKCAEEIMAIGEDVRPEQVLEKARNEDTELHKCFTWDDTIAAEKYRLVEARRVLKLLIIEEKEPPQDRPPIRLFHKTKEGEGYKHVELVVKKPDEYEALLARAYAELKAFKAKYAMLEELREIFDLID